MDLVGWGLQGRCMSCSDTERNRDRLGGDRAQLTLWGLFVLQTIHPLSPNTGSQKTEQPLFILHLSVT